MKEIIDRFELITGFQLKAYLENFVFFIDTHQRNIINWFSGKTKIPNALSFDELNKLVKESLRLDEVIQVNNDRFDLMSYWELLERIEDIKIALKTIENSSKFLRSSITKNNFNPNFEMDYLVRQQETLENVSSKLGSTNKQNDWVDIALRNDLKEEDYTLQGGKQLKVSLQGDIPSTINDVLASLVGESILGLDIKKKLTFVNNDLEVLDNIPTFKQAIEILANLRKADNPEFEENGISKRLVVGGNIVAIIYPLLFRQLFETFQHDDTIRSFQITKLERRQDALFIEAEIESKLGDLVSQGILI